MSEKCEPPLTVSMRWFTEVWNQRRVDTAHELWADGGVGHVEGMPDISLESSIQYRAHMLAAFPDFHVHILDVVESDGRVVTQWKITGTHAGCWSRPADRPEDRGIRNDQVPHRERTGAGGADNWNLGALLDRLSRPTIEEVMARHRLTRRRPR